MLQTAFEFLKLQPPRPKRPERLFFSLFPPIEAAASAAHAGENFLRDNGLDGKLLRTDRLHVSLQHAGDYGRIRTKFIFAACQAAKSVSMRPFEVAFSVIKSLEGAPVRGGRRRRPLVLISKEDEELQTLHRLLGAAMEKNGLRASLDFTPHITLAYGSAMVPEQAIEPIRFAVDEFFLIHSRLWLTEYHLLDRWPLTG